MSKSSRPAAHQTRPSAIRKVVNLRVLLGTLVVLLVAGAAAYAVHAIQVRRNANALLAQAEELADKAEKPDDYMEAAGHLFRYVQLRPDDPVGRVRLAETFDRATQARTRKDRDRAIELYYEALGMAPEDKRAEIHCRLAEMLNEARRFTAAKEEADKLLELVGEGEEGADQRAKGTMLLARALYGQYHTQTLKVPPAQVGDAFERARKLNPHDVELSADLAVIYREERELVTVKSQFSQTPAPKQGQPTPKPKQGGEDVQTAERAERVAKADQIMNEMVEANEKLAEKKPAEAKLPEAYLARYQYRVRYANKEDSERAKEDLARAKEDLKKAIELGPDHLEVVLTAAAAARQEAALAKPANREEARKTLEKARKYYQAAIEKSPADPRAYLALGDVHFAVGDSDLGMAVWKQGLERASKNLLAAWTFNARMASGLIGLGETAAAEGVLKTLASLLDQATLIGLQPADKAPLEREHDLLRARCLSRKGEYAQAIEAARRVVSGPTITAQGVADAVQASLLTGEWYATLSQWQQAAQAFEQAAKLQPKAVNLQIMAARAWSSANRPDMALRCYEQAVALSDAPGLRASLAWAHFRRELARPKGARDWDVFSKVLAGAKSAQTTASKQQGEAWRLGLLEAEYILLRAEEEGKADQGKRDALNLLRTIEQQAKDLKDSKDLLLALAFAYERLEQPAEAERMVAELEKKEDAADGACLLRARLAAGRKQYAAARQAIESGLGKLPPAAHPRLRRELIQISLREGKLEQAAKEFQALQDVGPADVELLCQLAETAVDTGKPADAEPWETMLHKIEGDNGLHWRYYHARRLLAQAERRDDPRLAQAGEVITQLQAQHPGWGPIRLLQALLLEVQGKPDEAIQEYKEALRFGEQRLAVYERLIALLSTRGRQGEAERYLELLEDQTAASERLTALDINLAAARGQMDRALEVARRRAEKQPKDPTAHVWLGQMLLANGKKAEAEAPFVRAAELAPDNVPAQGALFGYYVRVKQPDKARAILQKVAANTKLKDPEKSLSLAQGYELLKDDQQALANYRQAAKVAADKADVQLRLADYLLRSSRTEDTAEAEKLLRDVIQRWPDNAPARRMLAGSLVERGGEAEWQEAQRLLSQAGEGAGPAGVDRRLQAAFLLRRGGKQNRAQARQILAELAADPKQATATDRVLLAGLEEEDGRPDEARRQFALLVGQEKVRPEHLASYVDFLLRRGPADEVDKPLKRLEKLAPDHVRTVGLRARWLHAQKRTAEVAPMVEAWAEKLLKKPGLEPDQEAQVCETAGAIYAVIQQWPAAERWYRRLHKAAPARFASLTMVLARQNRMKEAIELCAEAAKTDSSTRPCQVLAEALVAGQPTAEDLKQAEPLFNAAAEANKTNPEVLFAVASFRLLQGRYEDAAAVYRQVVAAQPGNPVALNNLATVLSERAETRKEALTLIDQAIKLAGPQAWLYDTKGTILLHEGRDEEAVPLLEEATSGYKPDPRFFLHLAAAYKQPKDDAKARTAWKNAEKGDLKKQILTPADQKLVQDLEKKYGS